MGGYSWFANSIPQIESKPPQELSLEGGNVTPAQLVKAGEEIYQDQGHLRDLPPHRPEGDARARPRRASAPGPPRRSRA